MDFWLRNGRLYVSAAAYEQHLRSYPAVALTARNREWLLIPLLSGAGGSSAPKGSRTPGGYAPCCSSPIPDRVPS